MLPTGRPPFGLESSECSYLWDPSISTAEGASLDASICVCAPLLYISGTHIFVVRPAVVELMNKFYCFCFCCCVSRRPVPVSGLLPRTPEVTWAALVAMCLPTLPCGFQQHGTALPGAMEHRPGVCHPGGWVDWSLSLFLYPLPSYR